MIKKVFRSIFIVTITTVVICFAFIMLVLYTYFSDVQKKQLQEQTVLIAQGVNQNQEAYFNNLTTNEFRLTWIASDGTVKYDSVADVTKMENHIDRSEVQKALKYGAGESERYSSTLSEKTIYYAKKLEDGSILRVSVTNYSILSIIFGMIQPICIILAVAVILSLVLASRISHRIVAPLNKLNLDQPLLNDTYEEIAPLLRRIERQRRRIDEQVDEMKQKQEEFTAVTSGMNEGLVLLNRKGLILSINHAAQKIFGVEKDCTGQDILAVERHISMQNAVDEAMDGKHAETLLNRDGTDYQIDISPIILNNQVTGAAILIFNVTEKSIAEQQRREFTANVSHELKTPLHSIMGAAELIENNLVKKEDIPHFVGRIYAESKRLVALVEDIIRLSQLDEGVETPTEPVKMMKLATEVMESLETQASLRYITLSVQGSEAIVIGSGRLLHEVIYNLCDNAIKYNKEGGYVKITVESEKDKAVIQVEDNGIGIPAEHQDRIFERFYRVDKSHSKETGGTGLGLSIVKHAVAFHHGIVKLHSEVGIGTCITIILPMKNE